MFKYLNFKYLVFVSGCKYYDKATDIFCIFEEKNYYFLFYVSSLETTCLIVRGFVYLFAEINFLNFCDL